MTGLILGALFYLIGVLIGMAIEWAVVCGIVYVLSLCFSFTFDLLVTTGIWILCSIVVRIMKAVNK